MAVMVDSFWSCGGSLAGESVCLEVLGVWIWLESHAKLVAGEADREAGDRGQVGGRGAHFVDLGVNLGGGGGGGCCLGNLICVGLDDDRGRGGVGGRFCRCRDRLVAVNGSSTFLSLRRRPLPCK